MKVFREPGLLRNCDDEVSMELTRVPKADNDRCMHMLQGTTRRVNTIVRRSYIVISRAKVAAYGGRWETEADGL